MATFDHLPGFASPAAAFKADANLITQRKRIARAHRIGLGGAHETKLNRLCLSILTGNVTLLDTYALFDDTNHGNDLSAGAGSPSDSQWEAMELKYWA